MANQTPNKIDAAWIFGTFEDPHANRDLPYNKRGKPSLRWHVCLNNQNRPVTWCGLRRFAYGEAKFRNWEAGPPPGAVCAPCDRYFRKAIGLGPVQVSQIAAQEAAKAPKG